MLGVAVGYLRRLYVVLDVLAAITTYITIFTVFKTVAGLGVLALHFHHEWVILSNLFLLLTGFALLSRHFEKSQIPDAMPALLPDDWKGALALLVVTFVLSS